MGHWGFVLMAYGIVWSSILVYVTILKRRLAKAERNLVAVHNRAGADRNEKE